MEFFYTFSRYFHEYFRNLVETQEQLFSFSLFKLLKEAGDYNPLRDLVLKII